MSAPWWQTSVIYQILVRSFQDSNGDGQGDLPGVLQRLDYLRWLGVDALWLSPLYDSPWKDCGYDVSNFEQPHPSYGTLDDVRALIAAAHERQLRVILDWVPNHTSDQHPWFQEARASRDNPRRAWYVWADAGPDGGPPNNWVSVFGGSAWTRDEASGQWYFHAFLPEQPDLNWREPAVREAMCANLRYWADLGVDGFRIDAVDLLLEDRRLRSNPENPEYKAGDAPDNVVIQRRTRDQRGNHVLLAALRRELARYPDLAFIGETYLPPERTVSYYGSAERPELHLPLNLQLLHRAWEADAIRSLLEAYYGLVPPHAWPAWSLGNHDIARLTRRARGNQARVAALLLLTLRGTVTLYYGDEIGMREVQVPEDQADDPQRKSWPGHSRDGARTPMQWDASPGAGFTTGEPWLPLARDYAARNVAQARQNPQSLLALYRRLLEIRRVEPALHRGELALWPGDGSLLAYERRQGERTLLVVLNLSDQPAEIRLPRRGKVVLSTFLDLPQSEAADTLALRGDEGLLVSLS